MKKNKSVCFISFEAYPGLADSDLPIAGGAEFQQISLARELCKNGFSVSFITGDFGQAQAINIEGIKIYKAFNPRRRNLGLNFLRNVFSLYRAMKYADADIYNFRSDSFYVGIISFLCQLLGRKFVFSAGIDTNALPEILKMLKWPMPHVYKWSLNKADMIVAQTKIQKRNFLMNFGVDSVLIRNCIKVGNKIRKKKGEYFLWIGTINTRKRPDLYLEVASSFSREEFLMIGGPDREGMFNKIQKKASKLPNVKFLGFVPQKEIYKYFEAAKALICTSESEGFPNTFLQAWKYEVPVISLNIDPDEIICNNNLGYHSRDFKQMLEHIENIASNADLAKEMGRNGRKYIIDSHDINKITEKYINLFNRLY